MYLYFYGTEAAQLHGIKEALIKTGASYHVSNAEFAETVDYERQHGYTLAFATPRPCDVQVLLKAMLTDSL